MNIRKLFSAAFATRKSAARPISARNARRLGKR